MSKTNKSTYNDAKDDVQSDIQKGKDSYREKKKTAKEIAKEKNSLHQRITKIRETIIPALQKELNEYTRQQSYVNKQLQDYRALHKNEPGYPTIEQQTVLNNYLQSIAEWESKISSKKAEIDLNNKILKQLQTKIANLYNANASANSSNTPPAQSNNSSTSSAPRGNKIKFSTDYKYNAPMVSEAYFGGNSFINTILEGKFVDQGKYGDAREAWKGSTGGRGTIQMDEKFLSTFTTSTSLPDKIKLDTQKYGFKFLYNPQTVSMSWGLMNYMSPPYEAMAQDPFQVISAGLMTSVVTFDLVLNRIKDFDYLDKNGFVSEQMKKFSGANIPADLDPAQRNRIYSANYLANNPYPETIPIDDLQEIYEKGTMYDLEYLFKTINGPDGTFVSKMNGTTADKGWMRPTIVELHLGNKLRYRVRITEFAVNHVIFNPRMVPIFSTVRMTCNRFADGPESDYYGINAHTSGISNAKPSIPSLTPSPGR